MAPPEPLPVLVVATRNAGKVRELAVLLDGIARRVESLVDHPRVALPPETETSYHENALAKARAVAAALGLPALGDDSGLEVDAIGGAPGVRSARYAGAAGVAGAAAGAPSADRANNERLLEALRGVPPARRAARFRCVLAMVGAGPEPLIVEGSCEGRILDTPRGAGGFGYDPLFLPAGESRSFAELPDAEKNAISHRARAAEALRQALRVDARR